MKKLYTIFILLITISINAQENTDSLDVDEVDFFALSFDELSQITVSTASKTEEGYEDVPGVVTIITADEIVKFGAVSLVDVLERATSLIMTGSSIYPQNMASMRGDLSSEFDNHILLLIDGNPYKGSITEGTNFPLYLSFPLSIIDKIEIIRGPGSVLYGTNAYQGVINIITKTNKNEGISGISSFTHGSYEGLGTENTILYKNGEFDLTASFKYFDEKGWDFNALDYDSVQRSASFGEHNIGVFLSARYKKISFSGFIATSGQDNIDNWDTIAPGTVKVKHSFLNFGYSDNITDNWETYLNATLNFDNNNVNFNNGYQVGSSNDILLDFYNIVHISKKFDLLIGGNIQLNQGQMNSFIEEDSVVYLFNDIPKYRELNYIGYANLNYKPTKRIKLTAGIQINKPYYTKVDYLPRVGAIFSLENGFGFKANYGQAYRSPSLLERNYSTVGFIGNPNLLPERISTFDMQVFYNKKDYQFSLTYFNSEQKNIIGVTHYPGYYNFKFYENQSTLYSGGIELDGKMYITKTLFINSSLTYQLNVSDSSITDDYRKLFIVKAGVSYDIYRGIDVALFNTFYYNQLNSKENPYTKHYNLATLKTGFNISELFNFNKSNEIILSFYIYNLFDEEIMIQDIAGRNFTAIPAKQGRSAYGSIIFVF